MINRSAQLLFAGFPAFCGEYVILPQPPLTVRAVGTPMVTKRILRTCLVGSKYYSTLFIQLTLQSLGRYIVAKLCVGRRGINQSSP